MDLVSFRSVFALLGLLSVFVTVVTNYWRQGNIDLTGRWANMRGIYKRSVPVGIILAALLRANIIDIFQNPESPALLFGWLNMPWGEYATTAEKVVGVVDEIFGILVTGVVLAFLSKFWNDLFDVLYEFKRWLRGKANATKPEEGAGGGRPSTSGVVRHSRAPRHRSPGDSRRGGGSDRGGRSPDRGGRSPDRGSSDRGSSDRGSSDRGSSDRDRGGGSDRGGRR